MPVVPVQIERVLELEGAYRPDFNCPSPVYAHISKPVNKDGRDVKSEVSRFSDTNLAIWVIWLFEFFITASFEYSKSESVEFT